MCNYSTDPINQRKLQHVNLLWSESKSVPQYRLGGNFPLLSIWQIHTFQFVFWSHVEYFQSFSIFNHWESLCIMRKYLRLFNVIRLTLTMVVWDHPFKTSANFHDFWPLPPSVGSFFYYYPSANLANFWPLPPKKCRRLKWVVP